MSEVRYPRSLIGPLLVEIELPESYRIMPRRFQWSPLETSAADSRFASREAGYTVLYAATDFATAFVETVVRDRLAGRKRREVALREVTARVWVQIAGRPGRTLTLLDLRGDGCARIGAPTDVVGARSHSAGRAFGRAIYDGYPEVEGVLYESRLNGADAYAVFDRGIGKLAQGGSGPLKDHAPLPTVLARYNVQLVR